MIRKIHYIIYNEYIKPKPFRILKLIPPLLKTAVSRGKKRTYEKNRLWLRMLSDMPEMKEKYDLAIAYWGDRTLFYMCDKVKADKKLAWLHFDYNSPPRENAIYEKYFSMCDKVITVSESIAESLKNALPSVKDKITVLENFTDREGIIEMSKVPVSLEGKGVKLLTVGRIAPQKGCDLGLGALERLKKEGCVFSWYIIGSEYGEYAENLKKRIQSEGMGDCVHLLGTTDNPYKYMKAADIYFQPSRHEGKPIAVEEAKILCLPILVTRYMSADEQLDGGRLGVIVGINEDEIYEGLKKLICDFALRKKYSECLTDKYSANDAEKLRNVLEM